jgi:hypothetical protein
MRDDATTPDGPGELVSERSRAAMLAVFVALLVAVPLATVPLTAAQPADRTTWSVGETTTTESEAALTRNETTTSGNETTSNATTPPENVTYIVVVYPTAERLVVRAEYTTYSSVEAARAENGTLDTSWFDGDERIREAFAARGNDELVRSSNVTSRAVFPEAEYTDVIVEVEFEWRGVFGPDEKREVIGPRIAKAFRPGDRLVVKVFEWKPEAVNTDAEPTSHPGNVRYEWTISESDEPPRIVFNRSVVDDDGGSPTGTPLGPAGGILPALVALLFLVWLLGRG